ncbi:hypothetical protein GCM10022394_27200 [Zobellella aerophila]|uniref:Uncharacterized protein n=2 Tax=Zobellella aerophila TaxID=870480 RepID=A0ABP6W6F8_9GAMM
MRAFVQRESVLKKEARGYGMELSKFWHSKKLLDAFAAYVEKTEGPTGTIDEHFHHFMLATLQRDTSTTRNNIITDDELSDCLYMMDHAYEDAQRMWAKLGIEKQQTGRKSKK